MTPEERLSYLLNEIEEEFGGQVRLESKGDKWYWKVLAFFHKVFTFGNSTFMTTATTVMGPKVGLPSDPKTIRADRLYEILLHERAHHRQMAKVCKNLWIGAFFHMLLYGLVFFPFGLSYFRSKYEKEGYAETIRAWIRLYGYQEVVGVNAGAYKALITGHFSSATYGYMWPFKNHISKWYDETVERVAKEEGVL